MSEDKVEPNSLLTSNRFYILRYIAIIAMIADYTGAVMYGLGTAEILGAELYMLIRAVGRISFPIFAFELVESFHYTQSRKKHLLWIIGLTVISEMLYNLAFVLPLTNESGETIHTERCQSVMFTLLNGYLMLMMFNTNWGQKVGKYLSKVWQVSFDVIMKIMSVGIFLIISDVCYGEYGYHGIYLIAGFELARRVKYKKIVQALAMALYVYTWQKYMLIYAVSFVALIIIYIAEDFRVPKTKQEKSQKEKKVTKNNSIVVSKLSKYICRLSYPVLLFALTLVRLLNVM